MRGTENGHVMVVCASAHPVTGSELVLIRHGQGECNAAGVIGGQVGCRGLSEQGRQQSGRLAERLADLHREQAFDVVLSTPRPRVLQCAHVIADRLDRPVVVVEALRGQEFGVADGASWVRVTGDFGGPAGAPSGSADRRGGRVVERLRGPRARRRWPRC